MILITGASGGLGDFLVRQLSKDFLVVGTYNTRKPAAAAENAAYYQVDVSDAASIDRFVTAVGPRLDHVVLVNLAGISLDGMGHKMDEATWDKVVDTNLKGTFLMSRAILPFMRKQEWGRIVNVSSVVGQKGVPGTVAYASSKGGLYSLSRTLAVENATKNITVNALALGYFEVGMIGVLKPEVQEQVRQTIPMKRLGHPRNVELAIRFLIDADYVTGTTININGGLL